MIVEKSDSDQTLESHSVFIFEYDEIVDNGVFFQTEFSETVDG